MSKKLSNIISITLMVIGLGFAVYTWVATGSVTTDGVELEQVKYEQIKVVDPLFVWTYIIAAVAVLALIIVPLPYMLANPKTLRKFGFGVVVLGVVLLISFMVAPSNPEGVSDPNWLPFIENPVEKNQWVNWASANVNAIAIMSGLAILAIIGSGIRSLLNR